MTRAELYDRVWSTPMRKLAPEFSVSDVALAKLCRKHSVPTPPPGYWMQLRVGRAPKRPRLPDVDGPDDIVMPGGERTLQAQKGNRVARDPSVARPSDAFPAPGVVHLRTSLAGCHPMIRATANYFEGMARDVKEVESNRRRPAPPGQPHLRLMLPRSLNGRFRPSAEGSLNVLASIEHIRWVLLFHDALFRELKSLRAEVRAHQWNGRHSAQVVRGAFGLPISFTEGFAKRPGATSGAWFIENAYMATDDCRLTLERRGRGTRVWRASRAQLEQQIGKIAREIIDVIAEEAAADVARKREQEEHDARLEVCAAEARANEAAARAAADQRARQQFLAASRQAQAGRALSAGRQQLEYEATLRVLADIETRFPEGDEGEGLRTWLAVAREGLRPPVDALLAELTREIAVDGGPDWWPDGIEGGQHG